MKIKQTLLLASVLLTGLIYRSSAATHPADSALHKSAHLVKIGPAELYLAPIIKVDSALLKKLAVEDFLKKKESEKGDLIHFQNMQTLRTLLSSDVLTDNFAVIESLDQALKSAVRAGNLKSQSAVLNNYGVYFAKKGDLGNASRYFLESLKLKEKFNDKSMLINTVSALAEIYRIQGDYTQAIIYNEYAAKIFLSLKKKKELAEVYGTIGLIKNLQNKYAEAEVYILRKALPLYQSIGNKQGRMSCFENLAEMYYLQNKLSQAKWFCIQANLMAIKLNNKQSQLSALMNLGDIKNAIGEYDMALADYKAAAQLASENKFEMELVQIKGNLGETYGHIGDYKSAGNELEEYNRLKNALLSSANVKYN